jgi:carboxymethylenebutenolidase
MLAADLNQTMMDVGAAVAALAENGGKVAVIGFCWGGGLAIRAAQVLDVGGAVAFYGTRLPQYLDKPLKTPLLGHFGTNDDHIPPAMLAEAKAALPQLELHIYEVGHAFANDARPSYVAAAADLAHHRTEAFLATHLG